MQGEYRQGKQLTSFLRKENLMLKEENKELKQLLELNKEALRVSIQFKKGQNNFPALVNLLYVENSKLNAKIKKLTLELETGMCKALISEQIAFASSEQEKYLTEQLREKLTKMRKQLQSREKKLIQVMKLSTDQRKNHSDIKIVEITELNNMNKKMNDQAEVLREQIEQLKQENLKQKDQKDQLLKLNLILTKQINELKLITSQQTTKSKNQQRQSGSLSKFYNYQQRLIRDEDQEESEDQYLDENTPESSDIDDEEFSPQEQSKISKLEVSKVPKLQLKKAKEIQELIVQKINQDEKKKVGTIKQEKYKKLQVEAGNLRKKIGTIMVEKVQIEKQNSFLRRCVKELENRNLILLKQHQQAMEHEQEPREILHEGEHPTETLLQICRDVTLNKVLNASLKGQFQLQRKDVISYDI